MANVGIGFIDLEVQGYSAASKLGTSGPGTGA